MDEQRLRSAVESLLLVSENPVSIREMAEAFEGGVLDPEIAAVLEGLRSGYDADGRGMRLREAAGGWQLHTPSENAAVIRNMLKLKPQRLSAAALETLAIIAYRQPATRPEIEEIRGVDCGGVLKVLVDRRLIRILGKKDEVGRPFIYGTTREFLEFFGLKDLADLPTLKDFEQLSKELGEQIEQGELALSQEGVKGSEGAEAAAGEAIQDISKEEEALGGVLMEELNDAIRRLDGTRKEVIDRLGLKESVPEGEPAENPAVSRNDGGEDTGGKS
jgi:segregation and condensation protein B